MSIRRVLSTEDGNLEKSTLLATRTIDYIDIDLTFNKRPAGDIFKKRDGAAVKQSIKTLLLSNNFEKPFNPFFGADLTGMLFELADDNSESEVRDKVIDAVEQFEPRVTIESLDVNLLPDQNDMRVKIVFRVISTEEVITFTTNLSRLR